jgi:hypothetical protein
MEQKGPGSKRDKSKTVIPDKAPLLGMFSPFYVLKVLPESCTDNREILKII